MKFSLEFTLKAFKYWPPFLFSGISVREFNLDQGYIISQMKLLPWSSNMFGTMYGGNLFSMCDPFYVFILVHKLGRNYFVWDLEASIKFIKATNKPVTAHFEISDKEIERIREAAESGHKVTPTYLTYIKDTDGTIIAEVSKTLYVKKKKPKLLNN